MPGSESSPVHLACPQNNMAESTIAKKIMIIINNIQFNAKLCANMRNGLCRGCALPFHFIPGEHYREDSKKTNSQLMCPLLLLS
jgi:hypothetical protein